MGNCFKNFKIEEYIKMKPEGLRTLCGQKGNCSAIQEANQLETLSFLKSNSEISEAQLCPKCQVKVQLISGIKQETKCYLCGLQGRLKLVKDRHHLQTLSFLKNSDEITEAKLCLKCQEKVQLVAGIKEDTKVAKTSATKAFETKEKPTKVSVFEPEIVVKEDMEEDDV